MRKILVCAFACALTVACIASSVNATDISSTTKFYGGLFNHANSNDFSVTRLGDTTLIDSRADTDRLGIVLDLPSDIQLYNGAVLYYAYRVDCSGASSLIFEESGLENPFLSGNIIGGHFVKNDSQMISTDDYQFNRQFPSPNAYTCVVALKVKDVSRAYANITPVLANQGMILVRVYDPVVSYGSIDEEILNKMGDIVNGINALSDDVKATNQKIDALQQSIENQDANSQAYAVNQIGMGLDDFDIGFTQSTLDDMPSVSLLRTLLGLITTSDVSSEIVLPQANIFGYHLWDEKVIDLSNYEQITIVQFLHNAIYLATWVGAFALTTKYVLTAIQCVTGDKSYLEALQDVLGGEAEEAVSLNDPMRSTSDPHGLKMR